ncbi:LpxL/LpxP family acyltransferase [Methylocaldum szegediense]|uniref:LPLAT superfamily acyltransferase n=1 Tax=Methylocaldum szegediense TaxID=73780 RepID=A0ABN8X9F6_9GAMM|nr:lipid A biosynthesis acyltransferase [Methylocaldum szegediense]CAI8913742.1 putative LPLAT superfamily acyltransferase [Methylocaldum szegediense]
MSRSWITQKERSTGFWLRTIVWIALRLGRPIARALLYPITAYFLIFADRSRQASIAYLTRILGRAPTAREIFRHYHTFAETLLDRVFVFADRDEFFEIRVNGFELLEKLIADKRGFLLVGAHVGSFEILRGLGLRHKGLPVKALVYGENSPKINAIFKTLNPDLFKDIVSVGSANALLGLDEHVARGGVVALLGDRSVHGEKRVLCRFLGEDAWFPAAPVLLANLFKVPVILFVCLHKGDARYDVHFELLADRVAFSRDERDEKIRECMQHYADRLEHYCREAPYNWFNFYDFWDRSG